MGQRETYWSAEEDELLERLWARGDTASEISAQLHDRSRNAVLGRVHRLGMNNRAEPVMLSRAKCLAGVRLALDGARIAETLREKPHKPMPACTAPKSRCSYCDEPGPPVCEYCVVFARMP